MDMSLCTSDKVPVWVGGKSKLTDLICATHTSLRMHWEIWVINVPGEPHHFGGMGDGTEECVDPGIFGLHDNNHLLHILGIQYGDQLGKRMHLHTWLLALLEVRHCFHYPFDKVHDHLTQRQPLPNVAIL